MFRRFTWTSIEIEEDETCWRICYWRVHYLILRSEKINENEELCRLLDNLISVSTSKSSHFQWWVKSNQTTDTHIKRSILYLHENSGATCFLDDRFSPSLFSFDTSRSLLNQKKTIDIWKNSFRSLDRWWGETLSDSYLLWFLPFFFPIF